MPSNPFRQLPFQDWQIYLAQIATTQMRQPVGAAFVAAYGSCLDYFASLMRQAVLVRFPKYAPPDGLQTIGVDRLLPKSPLDTDSTYATKLINAWATWNTAGTALGILRALNDAGYPNTAIVQQLGGWWQLDANLNITYSAFPKINYDYKTPIRTPVKWTASRAFSQNDVVFSDPANNLIYEASNPGVTGTVQPIWPTTDFNATIQDNTIRWIVRGYNQWNRFSVVFFPPLPTTWGGVPPAYTSNESGRIRALINLWKSASGFAESVVILQAGRQLGYPVRKLAVPGNKLGTGVSVRWTPV